MIDVPAALREDEAGIAEAASASVCSRPRRRRFFLVSFDSDAALETWFMAGADRPDRAAHVAPEPFTDNVCNLRFIVMKQGRQRHGVGRALLEAAAGHACEHGAPLMLIDISSEEKQSSAPQSLIAEGHALVAAIDDFYGDGLVRVAPTGGCDPGGSYSEGATGSIEFSAAVKPLSDMRSSAC